MQMNFEYLQLIFETLDSIFDALKHYHLSCNSETAFVDLRREVSREKLLQKISISETYQPKCLKKEQTGWWGGGHFSLVSKYQMLLAKFYKFLSFLNLFRNVS